MTKGWSIILGINTHKKYLSDSPADYDPWARQNCKKSTCNPSLHQQCQVQCQEITYSSLFLINQATSRILHSVLGTTFLEGHWQTGICPDNNNQEIAS